MGKIERQFEEDNISDQMEVYPLPTPKGKPRITGDLFKGLRQNRRRLATFGIYGDPSDGTEHIAKSLDKPVE